MGRDGSESPMGSFAHLIYLTKESGRTARGNGNVLLESTLPIPVKGVESRPCHFWCPSFGNHFQRSGKSLSLPGPLANGKQLITFQSGPSGTSPEVDL